MSPLVLIRALYIGALQLLKSFQLWGIQWQRIIQSNDIKLLNGSKYKQPSTVWNRYKKKFSNVVHNKFVKIKDIHFCMNNLKMKRKNKQKIFDLPEQGFEPQIFSNVPAKDLNFHGKSF